MVVVLGGWLYSMAQVPGFTAPSRRGQLRFDAAATSTAEAGFHVAASPTRSASVLATAQAAISDADRALFAQTSLDTPVPPTPAPPEQSPAAVVVVEQLPVGAFSDAELVLEVIRRGLSVERVEPVQQLPSAGAISGLPTPGPTCIPGVQCNGTWTCLTPLPPEYPRSAELYNNCPGV